MKHTPVLKEEVIDYLDVKLGSHIIDATLGDGGHSKAILEKIGQEGKLLGIDQDPESIDRARENIGKDKRLITVQGNFRDLKELVPGDYYPVHGILLDLGWSSTQFEMSARGFSFQKDEPLDMRFDPLSELTASIIVNSWSEDEIGRIFRLYGEERRWRQIAKKIVNEREKKLIHTTQQLKDVIGGKGGRIHPATRVFQALRIAVNDELSSIKAMLPQATELLASGGRLVVISFHSLEDRIVKQFYKNNNELEVLTKKPVSPSKEEIKTNPRSRSAKLRAAEKI